MKHHMYERFKGKSQLIYNRSNVSGNLERTKIAQTKISIGVASNEDKDIMVGGSRP